MASIINRPNGYRWVQFAAASKKHTLRLGKATLKTAEEYRRRIEAILSARAGNVSLDAETASWLAGLSDVMHARLAALGLTQPRRASKLGEFFDAFFAALNGAAPRTILNLRNAADRLLGYFGRDKDFRAITIDEADTWAVGLRAKYKPSTAGRTIKRARQFAAIAMKRKLIDANPFIHLSVAGKIDATRQAFVDRPTTEAVMAACPSLRWRLIVALARFAALRVPSELAVLRWPDVRWDDGTMVIDSPKTGIRVVPIAPELRHVLDQAWDASAEGDTHVLPGITADSNLGTTLHKYIKRAGFQPWPKTFHNLRASCETEWMRKYPLHVACSWTGNSPGVALAHYARVTAEDQESLARRNLTQGEAKGEAARSENESTSTPKPEQKSGAEPSQG